MFISIFAGIMSNSSCKTIILTMALLPTRGVRIRICISGTKVFNRSVISGTQQIRLLNANWFIQWNTSVYIHLDQWAKAGWAALSWELQQAGLRNAGQPCRERDPQRIGDCETQPAVQRGQALWNKDVLEELITLSEEIIKTQMISRDIPLASEITNQKGLSLREVK